MTKHNFNFDDALTVNEFFASNSVAKKSFMLKLCHPENEGEIDETTGKKAEAFMALGLFNGSTLDDGRKSYDFFTLSSKLVEAGEELNKAFLAAHKDELMVLKPIDGLKFGILYLPGEEDDWDQL